MKAAYLEVRSWIGTVAVATHFYGKLFFNDRTDVDISTPVGDRLTRLNRDAKAETGAGQEPYTYTADEDSSRYYSQDEVVNAGTEMFEQYPRDHEVLIVGDHAVVPPQLILRHPDMSIKTQANNIFLAYTKLDREVEHAGWEDTSELEAQLDKLGEQWNDLLQLDELDYSDNEPAAPVPEAADEDDGWDDDEPCVEDIEYDDDDDDDDDAEEELDEPIRGRNGTILYTSRGQYPRPEEFPVAADLRVPVHVVYASDDNHVSTKWSETFYMSAVDVYADDDLEAESEPIGYIQCGCDGRLAMRRGEARVVVSAREIWDAMQEVFDDIDSRPRDFRMTGHWSHCDCLSRKEREDQEDEEDNE